MSQTWPLVAITLFCTDFSKHLPLLFNCFVIATNCLHSICRAPALAGQRLSSLAFRSLRRATNFEFLLSLGSSIRMICTNARTTNAGSHMSGWYFKAHAARACHCSATWVLHGISVASVRASMTTSRVVRLLFSKACKLYWIRSPLAPRPPRACPGSGQRLLASSPMASL